VEILAIMVKDETQFSKHASTAIHALYRSLSSVADDFSFDVDFDSGVLTLEFDKPGNKITVLPRAGASQVWISDGGKTHKLGWDIVENAFVLEPTGQTLKELLEKAIGQRVGDDVSL
jgi:iron donor protein CyaY